MLNVRLCLISILKCILTLQILNQPVLVHSVPSVSVASTNKVKVHVSEGVLVGIIENTVYGTYYNAFRGIPYAKPPVGELRFQDPQPPEPWSGERNAAFYGNICLQVDIFTYQTIGDEDCLNLNVYTRNINPPKNSSVMVWIHGGNFIVGDSTWSFYGPDYIIQKDVVLVTLNYRLGALGFLNLYTNKATGNQGLKDVVMALRWVRKYISQFGGDPNKITIFGENAGAVMVHYLTISPSAEGLFHKAICQSGAATVPWAFTERNNAIYNGLMLAQRLGIKTSDPKVALQFLKDINGSRLIGVLEMLESYNGLDNLLAFTPTIDSESSDPFLSEDPLQLLRNGVKIPIMFGYNSQEGNFFLYAKFFGQLTYEKLVGINCDFKQAIYPRVLSELRQLGITVSELRALYLKEDNEVSSKTIIDLANFVGDQHIHRGVIQAIDFQMSSPFVNESTYLYRFAYQSETSSMLKIFFKDLPSGVFHFEELGYLFYPYIGKDFNVAPYTYNTPAFKIMNYLTEMWTDFAKTGNPTSSANFIWIPVKTGTMYNYLNIDVKPAMRILRKGKERWDWKYTLKAYGIQTSIKQEDPEKSVYHDISAWTPKYSFNNLSQLCLMSKNTKIKMLNERLCLISILKCILTFQIPYQLVLAHQAPSASVASTNKVKVHVSEGVLVGIIEKTIYGSYYNAFRGIPYAKPPVGDLRFQDPQALPEKWSGERDAAFYGNICLQVDLFTYQIIGNEDCLYLNVYTNNLHPSERRAVMVWIHGGGFFAGDGTWTFYGPDYFMRKDVVLVTLNYRLGALGFLNLYTNKAPGNQGLKDVVMALRWVRKHISQFGGDPNKITIFGESAGAVMVHYLTISPLAEGLFHKAICQSGVATVPWAFTERKDAINSGLFLAQKLGITTSNLKDALNFLKCVDGSRLIEIILEILAAYNGLDNLLGFTPTIDSESSDPFLSEDPLQLLRNGVKIPIIFGFNNQEGNFFMNANFFGQVNNNTLNQINSDFKKAIYPRVLHQLTQLGITVPKLRELYFGNRAVSENTLMDLSNFIGDQHIHRGVIQAIDFQMNSPFVNLTYMYKFSYESENSPMKKIFFKNPFPGTTHFEELGYLFYPYIGKYFDFVPFIYHALDYKMMEYITEMWTSFAKMGNPTFTTLFKWTPVRFSNKYDYLNINYIFLMESFKKGKQRWDWENKIKLFKNVTKRHTEL
ncbi:uncharacterized protein LOC114941733 [Nylanderia fulva]|uniref:uncharacterized protein LOC114941733 n=1 Tax=Nylanderia fulva TaxID=613905 RepID=UPI0010FB6439|nr:uncharacterized protein LOC114941733 [Nylanderia fulva]